MTVFQHKPATCSRKWLGSFWPIGTGDSSVGTQLVCLVYTDGNEAVGPLTSGRLCPPRPFLHSVDVRNGGFSALALALANKHGSVGTPGTVFSLQRRLTRLGGREKSRSRSPVPRRRCPAGLQVMVGTGFKRRRSESRTVSQSGFCTRTCEEGERVTGGSFFFFSSILLFRFAPEKHGSRLYLCVSPLFH